MFMKKYLITIFISFILADKNCPVDQLYITSNYDGLVERRLSARQFAQDYFIHNRNILSIPVVFHNVHRIIDGMSDRSFCDYISGSGVNGTYTSDNINGYMAAKYHQGSIIENIPRVIPS